VSLEIDNQFAAHLSGTSEMNFKNEVFWCVLDEKGQEWTQDNYRLCNMGLYVLTAALLV